MYVMGSSILAVSDVLLLMAKRISIEDKLAKLRELEDAPLSTNVIKELSKVLSGANNVLVARAAQVVERRRITDLIPNLIAAFDCFMNKPTRADKGCLAKTAIIEALDNLSYDCDDIFLQGIHHVQKEPSYGGTVDTAATLRGKCAFALARIGYAEVLFELTSLLMDPEPQARIAAVKAIAYLARVESELLLRMKVMAGDQEPNVLGECFSGLLSINPERSMSFVSRFLTSNNPLIVEEAALALGESRKAHAFEILRNYREGSIMKPDFQEILLLSIALTRLDEAFEYLIDVISNEHRNNAVAALKALRVFYANDDLRTRIHKAVVSRNDAMVSKAWYMLRARAN